MPRNGRGFVGTCEWCSDAQFEWYRGLDFTIRLKAIWDGFFRPRTCGSLDPWVQDETIFQRICLHHHKGVNCYGKNVKRSC